MGHRAVAALLVLTSIQCGIDESGLLEGDAAQVIDAGGSDVTSSDVVQTQDALPDVPAPPVEAGICDEDADYCQPTVVPAGWSPVAYAESPPTSCPTTDWPTQDDFVSNIQNGSAACACGCTKTGDPNCTTGKIDTFASQQPGCATPGVSLAFTDGGCTTVGGNLGSYYASTAIAPLGPGSCNAQAAQSGSVATTPARTCTPESKCASATCAGKVPSGWLACIVADGDQPCPSGSPFAQKHAIAKNAGFTCGQTCNCSVSGTCTSPQIHAFANNGCNNAVVTLASDTTCNATNHNGTFIASATYSATPSFTCDAGGASAVQIQRATPKTVCCR